MSAAAPLPPPGPRTVNAMNGHPQSAHGPSADVWRGSDGAGDPRGPGGSGGMYPALAEIAAKASEKVNEMRQYPIGHVLESGKYHFSQAKVQLNSRSPASAYWEFLVAYQIVADVLPGHREYYDRIEQSRGQMHRDFGQLAKEIRSSEERFMRIKEIILNDNKRNGAAQPSVYTEQPPQSSRQINGAIARPQDELMLPSVPTTAPVGRVPPANQPEPSRRKPPVQPKPQSLHGRAIHQSSSSVNGVGMNDLADRFAKLRGVAAPIETASGRPSHDLSVKMPSPSDYHSNQPFGPRDMPPASYAPSYPPKLPLDTQLAASLPKQPSPTYSPARNLILPANINPPRSTARSIVGTGGRSNSLAASSASSHAPNANGQSDSYFPTQPGIQEGLSARRKSVNKPVELQITADKLYDYLRMYNVLLIDVRSRSEFDSGHIFVRSIMCIEPTSLQDGFSAEQLQDRLVISPDEEQIMYEQRNEYDLVVYYDECTKTHAFLQRYNPNENELALKRLFDTLYEFNQDKPLKRPPIFLMGGIDAWTDLVGSQALKMSSTVSLVANGQSKPPGLRRIPAVSHAGRMPLGNRHKREYRPMDQEEQRKWLEEARKGRSVVEQPYEEEEEEATSPMYRTTEEFMRRFPDIEEQQSMVLPPSRPQAASQYVAPSIPQAPSRPAPSVPRVSYSGVHERQLTRQSSGTQPSLYISPGRHGQAPLHRTGLMNFGVTCYMNSVIQCLSANAALAALFLTGRYTQDLQRNNFKGTQGILPEAYATLLSNLYKGDTSAIRPSTFRRICGHFRRDWIIDEQQDAKEFLEFVLDFLHEDLNTAWDKHPLKELTDADELARERLPRQYAARIEWNRYLHRDNSLIGNLFAGQHASKLTCATCGTTSTKYEAFWSISVEIPHDRACDVRDCLRSYCSAERLDTEDSWRCPRCQAPREATKKITITRAPDTLVIHFKRFSATRNESARKIRTPIYFPLQGLDMGPFMEPSITPEQESTDPAMNGPYMYNAYAIIWHVGNTLGSGHYIAFVKDKAKGCWRQFNDERVHDFEPANLAEKDRLQNEKAYVVFYERERVAGGI